MLPKTLKKDIKEKKEYSRIKNEEYRNDLKSGFNLLREWVPGTANFGLANDAGISGAKSLLSGYVWKSREKAENQVKNHFCLGDSRQNDPDRENI
jgi:hypothetical protein